MTRRSHTDATTILSRAAAVPPPVWLAVAAGLQLIVAGRRRPKPVSAVASVTVAAGSVALAGRAVGALRGAGTTLDPEHPERTRRLVADGPFAVSRNPVYLALAGLLLAHALWRRSVLAVLPAAGFLAVMDRVQVPREEAALRRRFGRRYDRYRAAVPRWIGAPED
ncbi:methyltransferase family protein [Microbacterium luticocti]|uniref:methyltransferase family protein n=1 Tax=Microbacterium luticocti TaxID=451764 RepID=UPI0004121453|nr:methyltransferase [Microbacterium luticocti]